MKGVGSRINTPSRVSEVVSLIQAKFSYDQTFLERIYQMRRGFFVLPLLLFATLLRAESAAEPPRKIVSKEQIHAVATKHVYSDGTVELFISDRPEEHNPVVFIPSPTPSNPEPPTNAADLDRGYIVFVPQTNDGVLPEYRPLVSEIRSDIHIFASPGEFEYATFCIRPLQDLGTVTFEVDRPVSGQGEMLDSEHCEVYILRPTVEQPHHNSKACRWTTKWIELVNVASAYTRKNLQVIVDIQVDPDAAPGIYRVPVQIVLQTGKASKVIITLEVLPIELGASMPWGFYMYQQHWTNIDKYFGDTSGRLDADEHRLWKLREMRRFGVTGGVISHNFHPMPRVSNDGSVDLSAYDKSLDMYRKAGFTDPPILAMEGTMWSIVKAMGDSGKTVPFPSRNFPGIEAEHVPENIRAFARKVFRGIHDYAIEAQWPPHYIYLTDEPFGPLPAHAGEMQLAKISYPLARQAVPAMSLACSVYSVDWWQKEIDGCLDLNIAPYATVCANGQQNRRWLDYAGSQHAQLRGIGWIGSIDTAWQGRHTTLVAEKGQLDGITCWVQWLAIEEQEDYSLHPYSRLRNEWKGGPFMLRRPDGHIWRSLAWLGTREGIDDSRYVRTVREMIRKARLSLTPAIRQQAIGAQERLAKIMNRVPWFDDIGESHAHWTIATIDDVRRDIANLAIDMQEAGAGRR